MQKLHKVLPWKMCITLRTTPERTEGARREFEALGWNVPFHVAERDDENPGRGCYTSHLHVMKQALKDGARHALVFEDDARIVENSNARDAIAQRIVRFMRSKASWDILLLGHCGSDYNDRCTKFRRVMPGISKSDCLCTHAVVYNRPFMRRFVNFHSSYPGYEIDDYMNDIDAEVVVAMPELFVQDSALESTIDDPKVERNYSSSKNANIRWHVLVCCIALYGMFAMAMVR